MNSENEIDALARRMKMRMAQRGERALKAKLEAYVPMEGDDKENKSVAKNAKLEEKRNKIETGNGNKIGSVKTEKFDEKQPPMSMKAEKLTFFGASPDEIFKGGKPNKIAKFPSVKDRLERFETKRDDKKDAEEKEWTPSSVASRIKMWEKNLNVPQEEKVKSPIVKSPIKKTPTPVKNFSQVERCSPMKNFSQVERRSPPKNFSQVERRSPAKAMKNDDAPAGKWNAPPRVKSSPLKPVKNDNDDDAKRSRDIDREVVSPRVSMILCDVKPVNYTLSPNNLYPMLEEKNGDDEENSSSNAEEGSEEHEEDGKKESIVFATPKVANFQNADRFSITSDSSFTGELLMAAKKIVSSYSAKKEPREPETPSSLLQAKRLIFQEEEEDLDGVSPIECHLPPPPPSKAAADFGGSPFDETASFTYKKGPSGRKLKVEEDEEEECWGENGASSSDGSVSVSCSDESIQTQQSDLVRDKIMELREEIIKENHHAIQAMKASKQCLLNLDFVNSPEHLEAEKLILLSQQRVFAVEAELIKLENNAGEMAKPNASYGCLSITNIRLPLNLDVLCNDFKDEVCNNLVCLIKYNDSVQATSVASVKPNNIHQDRDGTHLRFVDTRFPEKSAWDVVKIFPVYPDFKIVVEVFNWVVQAKETNGGNGSASGTPKKAKFHFGKKGKEQQRLLPKRDVKDRGKATSPFYTLGSMIFSIDEMKRGEWKLSRHGNYHSPLAGTIKMDVKCQLILSAEKSGLLSMKEVTEDDGRTDIWNLYWFVLKEEKLRYWRNSEDAEYKKPIGCLNLMDCASDSAELVSIYSMVCGRPNTFSLKFVISKPTSPKRSLSARFFEADTGMKQILLSANEGKERSDWCKAINEVLKALRMWSKQE